MRGSTYSGIGDGLQQIGGMLMNYSMNKMEDERYQKRLEAAERARAAREQADRERELELAKITPAKRRVYSGSEGETRVEIANAHGEMIGDELASPAEAQGFLANLRSAEEKRRAEKEAADWERTKFERIESGKDRRTEMSVNAPRGTASQAKPQLFELPSGEQVWVNPGAPIPEGARRVSASGKRNTAEMTEDDGSDFSYLFTAPRG
jgi:hypothetical protein